MIDFTKIKNLFKKKNTNNELDEWLSTIPSKNAMLDCDWNHLSSFIKGVKNIEIREGKIGNIKNFKKVIVITRASRKITLDKICEILQPISEKLEYVHQIIFDDSINKPKLKFLLMK